MTDSKTTTTTQSTTDEPATERAATGLQKLLAWWKATRLARGLARYGAANGALLTGGIAYSALFSIFAALTVAFSIFTALVGSNTELRDAVLDGLDSALPGIVKTGPDSGGILEPSDLEFSTSGSVLVAVIGFLVLLNTASSVMSSLRTGVRAMFGIVAPTENAVIGKLRDIAGFVVLALSVVLAAALGIVVGAAGSTIAELVGLDDNPVAQFFLRALGFVVALGVDLLVVLFVIRGLGGARPPRKDLLTGALVVAIAAGVIRFLGTSIVSGSVSANKVLAPFAAIIVLLLWVNLIVRILLMVCAWTANPPPVPEIDPDQVTHEKETPNFVTESEPETLDWDHDPVTGRVQPEAPPPEQDYWGGLIGWVRRKYRGFRDA